MLLNFYLLIVIAALLSLGIGFILFRVFSKNKKYTRGGFIAFFALMFIFTGIMMLNARAYIVTGKNEFKRFVVYGAPEYKLSNGSIMKLEVPLQKCLIVNDWEEDVVVEKVVYAFSGYKKSRDILVSSFSSAVIKTMSMDFTFDEKPPKQIESKNTSKEVRFWLRSRKDYENEYGKSISQDSADRIREALKKKRN